MIVIVLVAMGATASAIAIRLVLEKNRLSADATALQIVVPMQTAKEPAPAVAAQSGETLLAAAEQNRPRDDSTNGLESDLAPHVAAADTKSDGQRQNALPKALVPTQNPARLIDKEELANLLKRGRYLLSIGDIAPARLLLERAADANEANAAFDLAGTYDPAVLARSHALGIAPDLAMARMWYEKALNLGHSEAQARLAQLQK
jgi:TPR repeat protein